MALAPQTVQLTFGGGVDEATAPYLVNPQSAVLAISNAHHDKRGSLSKSRGCTTSPYTLLNINGASLSSGLALASTGDALVHIDRSRYARTWAVAQQAWIESGEVPRVSSVTRTPIAGIPADDPYTTAAYNATHDLYAVGWIQAKGSTNYLRMAIVDRQSGAVMHETEMHATDNFRVASVGGHFVCVYENTSSNVTIDYLDASDPGAGWTQGAATFTGHKAGLVSSSGLMLYDIVPMSSTTFAVVFPYATGTSRVYVKSYETAGWTNTGNRAIDTSSTDPEQVCGVAGDVLWIAYSYGTAARAICLSVSDLTVTATVATWYTFASALQWATLTVTGTQTAHIIGTNATDGETVRASLSVSGGAVVAADPGSFPVGAALGASHAFRLSSRDYALFLDGTYTSYALADWSELPASGVSNPKLEATFAQRLPPVALGSYAALAHQRAMNPATNVYAYAIPVKRAPGSCSVEVVEFDFNAALPSTTSFGSSLQMSGGVLTQFDGRGCDEVNFAEKPVAGVAANTGAPLANGDYQHVVVFERTDANGDWHTSAPSDVYTTTTSGGTQNIRLTLYPPLSRRLDMERFRFTIYRSLVGAGAPFYFVAYAAMPGTGATYVTYDDYVTDAVIAANRVLYTEPGGVGVVRPHRSPPALAHLTAHQDRIAGVAEDRITVWHSAPRVAGEGAWFADAFQVQCEQGGPITALWSQAGRLVVAKAGSLYVIDGDGPPENGGNGTEFTVPVRLPCDVGCITHRSVVSTDIGTFFLSSRGIELMDRSFQVQYIGEPIADTVRTYAELSSAVLDSAAGFVRFALVDSLSAPTVGRIVMYDIQNKAWSVHTYADEAVAQTVHGTAWHWLAADGQVYVERDTADASAYLDGSTWRTMSVETGWIKLGLLQDSQIWGATLLYDQHTDHDLTIEIAYDYDGAWTTFGTWDSDELYDLDGKVEIRPDNARAHAFKLRISDATPSGATRSTVGTGRGSTFVGLAVDAGARVGTTHGAPRVSSGARR